MLTEGSEVAGYRIERILGTGGMGAVYLAAHPTLPRRDALKVLSAELSRDADFRTRFTREADVAASLDLPQIVAVYDRGQTEDGQLWIAMQYVDGTDADAALRAGQMTPERAVHIIGEVAKALDYAHGRGIVHRDIKPANFLLSGHAGAGERVLLGDFGIARALDDVGLTATGLVMATIAYAAPEVISGEVFDGRADIYSLGCTLFRLVTGKAPFAATNGPAAVMKAHLMDQPPRVTDVVPALPAAFDDVIAIAMAKDPAARFPAAAALAAAATEALRNPNTPRRLPSPPVVPVPGPEVISYPHTTPGAPPVFTAPPIYTAPGVPAPRRTGHGALIGALAGVVVLVAGIGAAVAVWPDSGGADADAPADPEKTAAVPNSAPLADVAPGELRPLLLTTDEIPGNTGDQAVVLETDGDQLLDDSATIDNQTCLGAWAPAQQAVYGGSGHSGVAVQTLRALYEKPWRNGVVQAVVAFPTADEAGVSLQLQRQKWEQCAGTTVTVTPAGEPGQPWQFGQPVNRTGAYTLEATPPGSDVTCQHALSARANVLIDVKRCGPVGSTDVSALVAAIAAKMPRQQ
ncbi:serine/threonine protein kinase [Mycolicibacterium confluentis]|uniref:non-specific serine/threonine protein kinase n=2 Tax=Mycolicibacterium confluentis TaxID=28047 RepID=A0A7I7Y4M8_9MYCO|nr:serine/threonine-protein kinase PknH/PknJ [Mycolicibacterium confluentis]MCV7318095.1 sensor domain-containing protein [Mycolicibacterium confluentis]ORV31257.1 serine/threonine protein kinase [Mycolicibacterium confluentis]BBZ36002.1 serine/threonine-protein kinase PknJ [Mycolicibacterium confluentis]